MNQSSLAAGIGKNHDRTIRTEHDLAFGTDAMDSVTPERMTHDSEPPPG
jgi:hypothetical protein